MWIKNRFKTFTFSTPIFLLELYTMRPVNPPPAGRSLHSSARIRLFSPRVVKDFFRAADLIRNVIFLILSLSEAYFSTLRANSGAFPVPAFSYHTHCLFDRDDMLQGNITGKVNSRLPPCGVRFAGGRAGSSSVTGTEAAAANAQAAGAEGSPFFNY